MRTYSWKELIQIIEKSDNPDYTFALIMLWKWDEVKRW